MSDEILIPPTATITNVVVPVNTSHYYVQIDLTTNLVVGISELHSVVNDNSMIEVDSYDTTLLGKLYNDSTKSFEVAPDTNTYLHITTPAPTTVNTDITVTVDIKDAAGNLVPVNSTYYVPVIRTSDNIQALLLVVNFVNGQASNTFQIKDSGIYTIKLDKISPKPTSILQANVELIVV